MNPIDPKQLDPIENYKQSWTAFARFIHGKSYSLPQVESLFYQMVSPADYAPDDAHKLIKYAYWLQRN